MVDGQEHFLLTSKYKDNKKYSILKMFLHKRTLTSFVVELSPNKLALLWFPNISKQSKSTSCFNDLYFHMKTVYFLFSWECTNSRSFFVWIVWLSSHSIINCQWSPVMSQFLQYSKICSILIIWPYLLGSSVISLQ